MTRIARLIALTLLLAGSAFSNEMTFGITRAELGCTLKNDEPYASILYLFFDKSLNADELISCRDLTVDKCKENRAAAQTWIAENLLNQNNYRLLQTKRRLFGEIGDIVNLKPIPGPTPKSSADPNPEPTGRRTPSDHILDNILALTVTDFDLSENYVVLAQKVSQESSDPTMIVVKKNSSCDAFGHKLPDPEDTKEKKQKKEKESWEERRLDDFFSEPAIKENPVLRFDFGFQGAKKQKALMNFDVKFRPYTTRRLGLGGHYEFTWFFVETVYNINAKEGDKKNVLNVGAAELNWTKVFRDDGGENANEHLAKRYKYFPGIRFSLTPKMETEWRFKEMNFLLSPRAELPINLYQSRQTTLQLAPFVGIDLGIKALTADKNGPGWQIQRPFFGGKLIANLLRAEEKALFEIEMEYIRRLFLHPELSYGFDSNGKEIPDRASRRVREHGRFKVTWNAAKLFAPFVQWEYGRVPPNYSLLNHSFKTGFTVNADLAWKAFK